PSGGWSESARAAELSLLSTQAAVEALERLCARLPDAEQLEGLCDRARRACLGHGAADGVDEARVRWWPQVAGDDEPSPSATALAVLLLSRGNAHQQRAAREGVDWLFRHAAQWATSTEGDAHSRTANWRHMTFSLGLRAVLSLPDISPRRRELQRTIALLDELWHEEQGGWSHGKPGIDATPTGCHAVVLAVEALAGSYRFDPDDLLVRKSRRPPRSPGHAARREVCLDSDGFLTVIDLGDRRVLDRHPLRARVASTKEGVVRLLIERQLAHPGGTLEEVSMTTAELQDGLGIEPQSIAKAISRLNDELAAAAPFDNGTLAELIQPVNAARRLPDRRWRIDADAFSFDRPADKTRPDGAVIGR
ncbi:MAG: hypothetical protein JWM93_182, partial [Frankiales bacterium]|nr:hypothetical protein [Frankiales bacterium]